MQSFHAAPFDLLPSEKLRAPRRLAAPFAKWLLGSLLALALIFGGGTGAVRAAPPAGKPARVLAIASSAAPQRRAKPADAAAAKRAHRDATWRAWLLAQAAALVFGLLWIARAEANERSGASAKIATRLDVTLQFGARLALLTAFSLPIAALWLDARRSEYSRSGVAQIAVALALAILATLCGRLRARFAGTFALLLCSAAGVFTLIFFVLSDAAARYAWTLHRAPQWMLRSGGWLENAARETAAPRWNDAFFASHFDALNGGFFVAVFLIYGVASVLAAQNARRKVFEYPALEVRHTHPLSTAWTSETRAQIRLLERCGCGALLLALRPFGDAPFAAICLTTAAAFSLWGWRHRALDARRFFGALLGAIIAAALLLLLWLASARLDAKFRAPREYSPIRAAAQGATSRIAASKNAEKPRRASSNAATNRALDARPSPKNLAASQPVARLAPAPALASLNAFFANATMRGALLAWLILLAALVPLLRRPPPILWRVLGNTPAWGWTLLGGLLAAPLLLFSQSAIAFTMLIGTLFCAFVFVWLEEI